MEDLEDPKLGCIIPEVTRPAPQFDHIVAQRFSQSQIHPNEEIEAVSLSSSPSSDLEPLLPPTSWDSLAPFSSWNVLGNTRYSDCVAVTWANMRRLVTSKLTGRESYPNMEHVMKVYGTQNTKLDPRQGMVSQDLMDYLVDKGGPDGVRAIGYAKVNEKDFNQIRQAMAIFGALWIEISVYDQNQEEFEYKQPWKLSENDNFIGAHAVLAGGYSADGSLKIVTWGETVSLSPKYLSERLHSVWVVVWPEHLGSRRFTRGISMKLLRNRYKELNNKDLPVLPKRLNSVLYLENAGKRRYLRIQKLDPNVQSAINPDYKPTDNQRYCATPTLSVAPVTNTNASDGILSIDNDDLYLIRTKNTTSDRVETLRMLGPRYYDLESETATVTAFKARLSDDGIFCVDNGDLYLIKNTKPSVTGINPVPVEVHWAPGERSFKTVEKYVTGLTIPEGFCRAAISGGDLYLLAKNSDSACLEVYCARGSANYSEESVTYDVTGLRLDEISNIFNVGLNGDIYVVKTNPLIAGSVEVWIATAESSYKQIDKYTTSMTSANFSVATTGNWII